MRYLFKKNGNRKGQALILAYITIVFFTILTLPLFEKIISEKSIIERQRLEKEAFYLAEGAAEDTVNQFLSAIANLQIQPNVTRYPASGTIVTTYSSSSAFPAGAQVNSYIAEAEANLRQITDPDGTIVSVKSYIVTSSCQHPRNNSVNITINQAIVLRLVYAFQHAVFYCDDLEILPGPNMNFSGRIHSNKDMYIDSENTLTINSEYVHSAGNIYNKRKDAEAYPPGDVKIKKAGTSAYFNMNGLDSNSPN
ncbi:MAG: hypothetical protein WBI28_05350, partial [Candidatus Omnitrophota bacterium]